MDEHRRSFDVIVSTGSAPQDLDLDSRVLKRDGTLVLVGAGPERHVAPAAGTLIGRRRSIAGSAKGGIAETQEMPDFCAEHGSTADNELNAVQQVDDAYTRMLASEVKYRFVIDNASLPTTKGQARGWTLRARKRTRLNTSQTC